MSRFARCICLCCSCLLLSGSIGGWRQRGGLGATAGQHPEKDAEPGGPCVCERRLSLLHFSIFFLLLLLWLWQQGCKASFTYYTITLIEMAIPQPARLSILFEKKSLPVGAMPCARPQGGISGCSFSENSCPFCDTLNRQVHSSRRGISREFSTANER